MPAIINLSMSLIAYFLSYAPGRAAEAGSGGEKQQHTRALLELIDQCVLSGLKERLVEIEKVHQRNMELEDCVKKLSLESQAWMNVAHSHEALVTSLEQSGTIGCSEQRAKQGEVQ